MRVVPIDLVANRADREHLAEEQVEAELFKQYGTDPERLVSALQREAMIAIKTTEFYQEVKQLQTQLMGPQDDPLVKVKEQEIQANAAADQAKDQNEKARIQIEAQRAASEDRLDQAKLMLDAQKLQMQGVKDATQARQAHQSARLQAIGKAGKTPNPGTSA